MADLNLARQLATGVIEALRSEGHILIAKGKGEALLRELGELMLPTLARVMPRVLRSEVHAEVTSTFGDEATDEAVEELVESVRDKLIDSEGVEDVFADDKVIDRVIFRTLRADLVALARTADHEEEDKPPISVRLGTLGYVAATAAKLSDKETLEDALERAALSASTELDKFDAASKTAVFTAREDDPEKRLEIEEAVEEELSDLVEMGLVDLPQITRTVPLAAALGDAERKALGKTVTLVAEKTLASRVCPATWQWEGDRAIKLAFTPLSEPNETLVDDLAAAFAREIATVLQRPPQIAPKPGAPPKSTDGAPAPARGSAAGAPPSSKKPAAPAPAPARASAAGAPPSSKKPAAPAPARAIPAPKKSAPGKAPAAAQKSAVAAPAKPAAKPAAKATKAKPAAKAKKPAAKRTTRRAED